MNYKFANLENQFLHPEFFVHFWLKSMRSQSQHQLVRVRENISPLIRILRYQRGEPSLNPTSYFHIAALKATRSLVQLREPVLEPTKIEQ